MKQGKRILALLIAAVMSTAMLVGCGSDQGSSTNTNTTTGADTDDNTAQFLIGGMGPLTGPAASYGLSVKQGAEIAIEEINAAGGVEVDGVTYAFVLDFEDDEASEQIAPQAYNALMDREIHALLGGVTSGATMAIVDQTYEDGILQITPSASMPEVIEHDNAFRTCFSDPEQGVAMAEYIVETLGLTKVAVIYNAADEYSTGVRDAFEAEIVALGAQVVASEAFNTNDVDFNTQLTTIRGTEAEAIYVPAYYQDATFITRQASEMGLDLPFFGSDGWDGILGTVTDAATVEGVVFTSPFCASVDEANVVAFVEAYEAAYNAIPDQFAAGAYDTIYAFKAAIEEAGSIESANLIAAMQHITVNGLTGDAITFDASGAAVKEVKFVTIQDGAYAYVD